MAEQIVFGMTYEDKRTHRSGVLISYSDKYKTYLMESSDGKSFNVTSSQFKVNWRLVETAEVKEEVKPEVKTVKVEPAKVKSGTTYKGPTEEQKKELNDLYTEAVKLGQKFIESFDNDALALKLVPAKNTFKIRIDKHIVLDVQIMVKKSRFRLWMYEEDFMDFINDDCKAYALNIKQYPYEGRCFTAEFDIKRLEDVLEYLRNVVIVNLAEIKGGK
jgi:hypothetical protein